MSGKKHLIIPVILSQYPLIEINKRKISSILIILLTVLRTGLSKIGHNYDYIA